MRLLDLFCGAGGAAMGYHRAGFEVVGVDIKPQKHYPFEFHQADAFDYLRDHGHEFDVIHASPPCQAYTTMKNLGKGAGKGAPELIDPVRCALEDSGAVWIVENVVGSPLRYPLLLCGSMFGLKVQRHRLFETSALILGMPCRHNGDSPIAVYGDHPQRPGDRTYRVNRAKDIQQAKDAMGIDWMDWRELTQAIPPSYTE